MNTILISGTQGSGKSTVAKYLAKKLGWRHVSAGDLMRQLACEKGFDAKGEGFVKFHDYLKKHPEVDQEVDALMIEEAEQGECVIDGRLMAYMYKDPAYRVHLKVPIEVAALRNAKRDGFSKKEMLSNIQKRRDLNNKRYQELYNIDVTDLNVYDLVLNTEYYSKKVMNELVLSIVKRVA